MRAALLLLAFSLPALAAPPCDTAEPKDVACIMSHDRNPETTTEIKYQWYEVSGPEPILCGVREPAPAYRITKPPRPARLTWNPYQFSGPCFPAPGTTKVYRVWACWTSGTGCSDHGSNTITVIGVPANEIRCCDMNGCGGC